MKKRLCTIFLAVIMMVSIAGCGGNDTEQAAENVTLSVNDENTGETIIVPMESEVQEPYTLAAGSRTINMSLAEGEYFLGAQYIDSEKTWLIGNAEGQVFADKGTGERELLLEGVSATYIGITSEWFVGEEYFYVCQSSARGSFLTVLNKDGTKLFQETVEGRIINIAQATDGTVAIIARQDFDYPELMVVDEKSHKLVSNTVIDSFSFWGIASNSPLGGIMIMDSTGVCTYDLTTKEKTWHLKWNGTTYDPAISNTSMYDARFTADGTWEMLTYDLVSEELCLEEIRKESFAELGKTILIYRTMFAHPMTKELVQMFNAQSDEYYVILESRDDATYWEDYKTNTAIEIVAGTGPDIIDYDTVFDIYGMARQGALENLVPYMQADGMVEEDYFQGTFQNLGMGEGYYGISYSMYFKTVYMAEPFTGDGVENLEELLANMESCEEDAIFDDYYSQSGLLYYFLRMSPDFHGMVDWEAGTCDFSGELWESMLENARRYGATDENRNYEEFAAEILAGWFASFGGEHQEYTGDGMTAVGYPVDDGFMHNLQMNTFCITATSKNKEGAWEFVKFMIGEQAQNAMYQTFFPVNRNVFAQCQTKEFANPMPLTVNGVGIEEGITEEQMALLEEFIADSSVDEKRIQAIWDIIADETELYFSGDKSIEEVSDVIENRVNLYLAEIQ